MPTETCQACDAQTHTIEHGLCARCLRVSMEDESGIGSASHVKLHHEDTRYTERLLPEFDDL